MKTVLVINNEGMGNGDAALGRRLLQTFINKSSAFQNLEAIVFYNAGVKLLADGSEILPSFAAAGEHGVDLIACGTCVDHFELREKIKVGKVGSMDEIIGLMENAQKVICP